MLASVTPFNVFHMFTDCERDFTTTTRQTFVQQIHIHAALIHSLIPSGFPTPTALSPSGPSVPSLFRRAPWDYPNAESGLCGCPNTRTFIQIVWSCVSSLILATWVTVHLNIPPKGASSFRIAVLRLGAMLATIVGPEITLWWVYTEWKQANELQKEMKIRGFSTWTMSHSFYAVMGGFVERDVSQEKKSLIGYLRPVHPDRFPTGINARFGLSTISEEEIQDKSKADNLTKTIAVCQLLWFSVQLIGRLLKGWAATELEVVTFGTCIITVVIHFFWWNKPLDVRCQTVLVPTYNQIGVAQQYDAAIQATESKRLAKSSFWRFFNSYPKPNHPFHRRAFGQEGVIKAALTIIGLPFVFLWEMGVNDIFSERYMTVWRADCAHPVSSSTSDAVGNRLRADFFPCLTASVFGTIHFITWSFIMPTTLELWLWRYGAIALTLLPILVYIFLVFAIWFRRPQDDPRKGTIPFLILTPLIICGIFHPIIRLVNAVDAFYLLRDLPDSALLVFSVADFIPSL